jgi:hypothetical protein
MRITLPIALLAGLAALTAVPAAGQIPAEPPLVASSNVHVLEHVPGSAAGMVFEDH